VEPKEIILHLLENSIHRNVLAKLYSGKLSFTELKRESDIDNNTTLTRILGFFDSVGLIVNIFERTKEGSYSHYELSSYGRRIAQIVLELEEEVDRKVGDIIPA
jgi:DNA-binding HxlR family transcriptional regulator